MPRCPCRPTSSRRADVNGGNAPFGFDDNGLLNFIPTDLNLYWNGEVGSTAGIVGDVTLVGADLERRGRLRRRRPERSNSARVYCASIDTVYLNEPAAQEIYNALGDFSVGYLIGTAWSEAVQQALGSDLDGRGIAPWSTTA